MKFLVVTFSFLLSTQAFTQAMAAGTVQVDLDEYLKTQTTGQDCVSGLMSQLNEGMIRGHEAYINSANVMLNTTNQILTSKKQCRNDLANVKQEYQTAQRQVNRLASTVEIKIRRKQEEHKLALISLVKQCEDQAGQRYDGVRANLIGDGVINVAEGGPQRLVGRQLEKDLLNEFNTAKNECLRQQSNHDTALVINSQLQTNIMEVEAELTSAQKDLADLAVQLKEKQEEIITQCKMDKEMLDLNKAAAEQIAQKSANLNSTQTVMGAVQAVGNCMMTPPEKKSDKATDVTS